MKKFIGLLITVLLLIGCSEASQQAETKENSDNINQVVENQETKKEPDKKIAFKEIGFNKDFNLEFAEMSLVQASTSKEILPTDTSSVYSYMQADDDETYFYLVGNIKNTSGDSFSVEEIKINFVFDDKYNYSGFVKADDGGNSFHGYYIKPFGSAIVYLMSPIPDELINSYEVVKVQFGFDEKFNYLSYRDELEDLPYIYEMIITK